MLYCTVVINCCLKKSFNSMNKNVHNVSTYPTIGRWKPKLSDILSSISCVLGWNLSMYLRNCPTHQAAGSPCSLMSLSEMSRGMANGRYGGRWDSVSIMGRSRTWVSLEPVGRWQEYSSILGNYTSFNVLLWITLFFLPI